MAWATFHDAIDPSKFEPGPLSQDDMPLQAKLMRKRMNSEVATGLAYAAFAVYQSLDEGYFLPALELMIFCFVGAYPLASHTFGKITARWEAILDLRRTYPPAAPTIDINPYLSTVLAFFLATSLSHFIILESSSGGGALQVIMAFVVGGEIAPNAAAYLSLARRLERQGR